MIIQDVPNLSLSMLKRKEKKGFLHGHEDLATIGKQGVDALRLFIAGDAEGEIDAAHRLEMVRRHVTPHDLCFSNGHAGIKYRLFPVRRDVARIRLLLVGHHRGDFASEVLFVETKSLLAITTVVEIGV